MNRSIVLSSFSNLTVAAKTPKIAHQRSKRSEKKIISKFAESEEKKCEIISKIKNPNFNVELVQW
jgi:hypothetical protein